MTGARPSLPRPGATAGLLDLADHRPAPGPPGAPARASAPGRQPALRPGRLGADSIEDAPWSAARNPSDAYGYAIFDVDPGRHRGETTITMQYFAVPAVTNESGSAHDGTTVLPTTPFETFVFGRNVPCHSEPPHHGN